MIDKYYYTDKEIEELCKSLIILVDTREKQSAHITDWFDKKKIPWKVKALSNGDYSFYLPQNHELNIDRDLYFDKEIMIERKRNLEEIGANFTTYRSRMEEELATFPGKKYLLLENSNYGDIVLGNYKTKISIKSFLATLHSFNHRYNWEVVYMPDDKFSGIWIYQTCYYYLRSQLRRNNY